MERPGKIVRARREALAMSQEQLAWLAGVSRTTIRNIEADRVEEARTWHQVERALGWQPGSLDEIRSGDQPAEALSYDALMLIGKAVRRRYEKVAALSDATVAAKDQYTQAKMALIREQSANGRDGMATLQNMFDIRKGEYDDIRERHRQGVEDLDNLQRIYASTMKELSIHKRIPPTLRATQLGALLEQVRQELSPGEMRELASELHRGSKHVSLGSVAPSGGYGVDVILPPPGENRVGSAEHIMIVTVRIPQRNFEDLDSHDLQWTAKRLAEMGADLANAIASSKRRDRDRRSSEM